MSDRARVVSFALGFLGAVALTSAGCAEDAPAAATIGARSTSSSPSSDAGPGGDAAPLPPSRPTDGAFDAGASSPAPTDAATDAGVVLPPASICAPDDETLTGFSTSWGPAWAPPKASDIVQGWPVHARYELWWIPMPATTLAYRIVVPAEFDATLAPEAFGQMGYIHSIESPSTPVISYDYSLSETACDLVHGVVGRSNAPPYGPTRNRAAGTNMNSISINFQVRPKSLDHCVPVPGYDPTFCLEPGQTYWWNLRLTSGCMDLDTSRCQPMIHVMRPKQIVDPDY